MTVVVTDLDDLSPEYLEPLREALVAAGITVLGVLGLINSSGFLKDLLRHLLGVRRRDPAAGPVIGLGELGDHSELLSERFAFTVGEERRVRRDLRAVDRDHPGIDQTGPHTQTEDLAEQARARRDDESVRAALALADDLASWVTREHDVPFTDHPSVAMIPAARATWDADRSRVAGVSHSQAWSVAASRWEVLGYRYRAGYARWRQAEALLATRHGDRGVAATVLSTAAGLAVGHEPLTAAIEDLARRARIDLGLPAEQVEHVAQSVPARGFGLTDRELDVLRLLAEGRTNPEIATALFISPRTVGVHVSSILRKLNATTRVHAATVAERAGLLAAEPAPPPAAT